MLTLVPLCFLFNWMLSADSMVVPFRIPPQGSNQDIPLSMAEGSVDDTYFGCQQEMNKVLGKYFQKEMRDKAFANAWFRAAECARKKPRLEDKALTKDHMQAICVYTSNDLYSMFNEAVLKQGPVYRTMFRFHSLHFLLTSAIQILKSKNHCPTSYRRTRHVFTGHVNQIVRFGTFASSSYRTDLTNFGQQTCFKIKTCFGAYLKNYSFFNKTEEEVLIPPYETFRVSKKMIGPGVKDLPDCKVVFELESAGVVSTLNCKVVHFF